MLHRLLRAAPAALLVSMLLAASAVAQTGRITGTVTDAKTGNRLIGTLVAIENNRVTGLSNAQGVFRLDNVPVGPHQVTVSRLGYGNLTLSVTVNAGEAAQVDFRDGRARGHTR